MDSVVTVARIENGIAKRGNTWPVFDSARSSLNVWPLPSKNFSAVAGLTVTASCCPIVSSSAGSAIDIDGRKRASFDRSHGMS
jgi:hypothetical protein